MYQLLQSHDADFSLADAPRFSHVALFSPVCVSWSHACTRRVGPEGGEKTLQMVFDQGIETFDVMRIDLGFFDRLYPTTLRY